MAGAQGWESEIRGEVVRLVVAGERGITVSDRPDERPLIPSRSLIVDASDYCDEVGHSAGPDNFQLHVDRRPSASLHFTD